MNPYLAINFALDRLEPFEMGMFLADWKKGDLKPWPEYHKYVDEVARGQVEGGRSAVPHHV